MKTTLDDVNSGYNLSKINENFQKIETELNDKVLYRNPPTGEPNAMQVNLDMNGNRLYNLPEPLSDNEAARLVDVRNGIAGAAANLISFTPSGNINSTNVQAAIQEVDSEIRANLASTASGNGAALVGYLRSTVYGNNTIGRKLQSSQVDVVADFFADNTGASDTATAILNADASGFNVRYPRGTYRFGSSVNPTFAGGITMDNATIVGTRAGNRQIVTFDKGGRIVGLQHNHREQRVADLGSNVAITTGALVPPPLSTADIRGPVDFLAHWYNDFGLECVRAANGGIGALTWYYWDWAHTDTTGSISSPTGGTYDPKRHPLLGWYRGDDATVLDWQCYWLKEHGLTGVILDAPDLRTTTWDTPSSTNRDYWVRQLFKAVPNFPGLRYALSLKFTGTTTQIQNQWTDAINNVYLQYGNFYALKKDGKLWPVVYCFDMAALRGVFDSFVGSTATDNFMVNMAALFQAAGYGGMAVFGRNSGFWTAPASRDTLAQLEARGVLMYDAPYANVPGETGSETIYDNYITNFTQTTWRNLPCVLTSRESKWPHPSGWTQTGSTPAKFRQLLQKGANAAMNNPNAPPVCLIYNVAEWAEAGASLQPSMGDGFGYLEALRSVASTGARDAVDLPYSLRRVDGASTNIKPVGSTVGIYSTFGFTLNSAPYLPTIAPGYDGQKIRLINVPSAGNFILGLNDNATTAGTNLFLTASLVQLGAWDSIELTFFTGKGWVQTGPLVNVL